jgi:hypothetical protein
MSLPEDLLHDVRALASHLGLDAEDARMAGADAFDQVAAWRKSGRASRDQYDHVRWSCIELLLWEAALREKWQRFEESRKGKRVVSASVGIAWSQGTRVSTSVGLRWRNRLFDLIEHPAFRDSLPPELYDIIYGVLKAQAEYDRELARLKQAPDSKRILELRNVNDRTECPPAMEGLLSRLEAYIARTEATKFREHQSRAGLGRRNHWSEELPLPIPLSEVDQRLKQAMARDEGRAPAIKRIAKETGRTPKAVSNRATKIWPVGRGVGAKVSRNR